MNTTLTLVNIFAVIILCELIASPTAAVPLTAERAYCIDAGFSQPAVMAACDAFIDIFTGDTIQLQLVTHKARTDHLVPGVMALLLARSATSTAVIQVGVFLFLVIRNLSWVLKVPTITTGEV